jgi:hypothetical protein
MRRHLVVIAVLALALPATALAVKGDAADGSLSVRQGHGTFIVNARGGIIGSFARGRVVITDPIDGDGTGPIVSGDDWHKERSDTTTVYGGTRVRFRLIGGKFTMKVVGNGVSLAVVGQGKVTLNGDGTDDDGVYSVNGGAYEAVPAAPFQFPLNASSP